MSNSTSIFELNSGQKIQLVELNQSLTYEGLIAVKPNDLSNAKIIERALEEAKRPHHEGAPYLIEPVQFEIELDERERWQETKHPSPFEPPMVLPRVQCVGRFEGLVDEDKEESEERWLVVVWFQNEFALPLDENALEAIQGLDWENVAHRGGGLAVTRKKDSKW